MTIIFAVALIWIACKMLAIGFSITWGIAKVLLPALVAVGLIYFGLKYLVLPVMAALGLLILFHFAKTKT